MNMDRKYKEAENRTSEYLELKYGTDVQSGLSLAEVRRRRHICGTYNIAKEKKRIWLIYLKKECQNPFFFFFLYLCGISRIFYFPKKIQLLLFFTLFFLIIINIRTAFRSRKIFFKQKEAKAKKVIVLREGVFQRIPWKYVLRGDIVRLNKGEQISSPVISLTKPYKEYQSGQVFTENTGRAIVIHTMDSLQEDSQWDDSNLRDLQSGDLQEELQEDVQIEHSQLKACGVENTTLQEKFSSTLKKVEEQILDSLCIFMCLSVVISLYIHQEGNMRRILEVGSLFIAVFMIGKEIAREVFRRYAKRLEKINNT